MELESFVFSLSIGLELLGVVCVLLATVLPTPRWAIHAEIGLIGCLCGLGSVTIIGAVLRMACGLVSGIAMVAMGLVVIFLADRKVDENPYATQR